MPFPSQIYPNLPFNGRSQIGNSHGASAFLTRLSISCGVDPLLVVANAQRDEAEFLKAQESLPNPAGADSDDSAEKRLRWLPSASGSFKINCDVAVHPRSSKGAIAVLLRDANGCLLDGLLREVGCIFSSPKRGFSC
ncbi:hypothetical protein LOK49_LG06G01265 [Camellia lanceoleosa]|uniref:Uncharacterized protein n=1 Tax=Camellia lanceoleosa TaxID=1840588 RepID=A0ACC0HCT4_9ERIC|nr:hypothetical protein LOK49_LG06G01265 [Camellia lanceoleosa]